MTENFLKRVQEAAELDINMLKNAVSTADFLKSTRVLQRLSDRIHTIKILQIIDKIDTNEVFTYPKIRQTFSIRFQNVVTEMNYVFEFNKKPKVEEIKPEDFMTNEQLPKLHTVLIEAVKVFGDY